MTDADPIARLRSGLDGATANDRAIAEAILADPTGAAMGSAESLAERAGVSKAAVVRFGARLGYGGFRGLQGALRDDVRARVGGAGGSIRAEGLVRRWLDGVTQDLETVAGDVSPEALERAATLLETGEGWIHVFGQRASAAVSEYAYFLLNPMLPNVIQVQAGESALADRLLDIGPEDRLIAVTFKRYAKVTGDVVSFFAEAGAPVVLITDSPNAPAARHATETLVCADASPGPFPTIATGIFLVEVLAATLYERNPEAIQRRLDEAQRIWTRFGTYGAVPDGDAPTTPDAAP